MNTGSKKKNSILEVFHFISTIISWTVFILLVICALLLIFYFISTQIYARKGEKYAPLFSLYTIVSGSMTPNINKFDVIVDTKPKNPESVKIGDVITFVSTSTEHMNATVTHRVISIIIDDEGNYSYQTKGDYNLVEDSAAVPYSNIIGIVALRIPQLGKIQAFIASSYGWMFLLFIVALYILLKGLLKRLKEKYPEIGKGPVWQTKFGKFMTRPLLVGQRRKLLLPPEDTVEIDEEATKYNTKQDDFDTSKELDNIVYRLNEDINSQELFEDLPIKKPTENNIDNTQEFTDDVNPDDLPELK